MLELDVQQIKDLQVCERYYDFKYVDQLPFPVSQRDLMNERFQHTLKRVASFFFYKKQGGIVPSYNALLNRWERMWFPKEMDAYDLAVEQHSSAHGNLASLSNVAVSNLIQFYDDFAEDASEILMLDEDFVLPVYKEARLLGRFDLVLRQKDQYIIIQWSAQLRRPTLASLVYDFAALQLAFGYRNSGKAIVPKYAIYDLASSRPGLVEVKLTSDDINAFMFWVRYACDNDTFVPRRGFTTYCKGCPFDRECQTWREWPKE